MKYWNKARIKRAARHKKQREDRMWERELERRKRTMSHTPGDHKKNALLMLDALGKKLRRRMLVRLRQEGAMSVSKLAEPFNLTLPAALAHVGTLERAGLITTKKQGRVRLCVYNPRALNELAIFLSRSNPPFA